MAIQDFTKLLGKRVRYWDLVLNSYVTGVIVAYSVYAKGFEKHDSKQVLFLQDGDTNSDFISSDYDFQILEN
jgi:hypothetical protein